MTDLTRLERVLDDHGVTGVLHLAALRVPFVRENPVAGAQVNVIGTVNVLEASAGRGEGMPPLVYASSIAEHGEHPSTLYGVFKLRGHGASDALSRP